VSVKGLNILGQGVLLLRGLREVKVGLGLVDRGDIHGTGVLFNILLLRLGSRGLRVNYY
jgi:hypothetical protein